jgi:hypothetical protein
MFLNFLFVFRFHAKLFELFRERVLVASHASTHVPSSSSATFPGVAHDVHYYYMILLLRKAVTKNEALLTDEKDEKKERTQKKEGKFRLYEESEEQKTRVSVITLIISPRHILQLLPNTKTDTTCIWCKE